MPQLSIDKDPLSETLKAMLSDPWAAIEVDPSEVEEACPQLLQGQVRHLEALPNVQGLQLEQGLGHLGQPLISDPAGSHGEGPEVEETGRDVRHRSVADSLAERNVQRVKTDTALSKVANANVTNVVTRAKIQGGQGRHPRHRLHPRVGNICAEAEVEVLDVDSLSNVPEGKVGQLLTILKVESIQLDQIGLLGIGVDGQPGKMGHACVAELPAGAKGESVQVGEGAGQQQQAGVGDPCAAAQVQTAQSRADGAEPSQAAVGDLLAEGEVDGGEGGEGGDEEADQALVSEAVAAAEVEMGESRRQRARSCHQHSQALLHTQHLVICHERDTGLYA